MQEQKLEFEIAAIYYFIAETIKATPYFEEVPEDMLTPCVFYPPPQQIGSNFSTSAYMTDFSMYVKFMDHTNLAAYEMASAVMQRILQCRRKIPIVDDEGKATGRNITVDNPVVRKVDNGVYQMEISWKRYTMYDRESVTLAQQIFMNMVPISL